MAAVVGLFIGILSGFWVGGTGLALIGAIVGTVAGLIIHGQQVQAERDAPLASPTPSAPTVPHPVAHPDPGKPTPSAPPASTLRDIWTQIAEANLMAKIGAVWLFIGLAYLLRYAFAHLTFPPVLRVLSVAAIGGVMLAGGVALRRSRQSYALILQGAGGAVLYLSVYGAMALYTLIDSPGAMLGFVVISSLIAALALWQKAQPLAFMAVAGGFLAPVVASVGLASPGTLFLYYTLLNALVLTFATLHAWRALNLIGFFFTFIFGLIWGLPYFTPAHREFALPYAVINTVLYMAVTMLYAWWHRATLASMTPGRVDRSVDAVLAYGVPMVSAALFVGLFRDVPHAGGWVCLAFAAIYAALAVATWRVASLAKLARSFAGLACGFAIIAAPVGLTAALTSAVWAALGVALLALALERRQLLGVLAALAVQAAAVIAYFIAAPLRDEPLFNPASLSAMILAIAFAASGALLDRAARQGQASRFASVTAALSPLALFAALLTLALNAAAEVVRFVDPLHRAGVLTLVFAVTYATAEGLRRILDWSALRIVTLSATLALLPLALLLAMTQTAILSGWGALGVAFIVVVVVARVARPTHADAEAASGVLALQAVTSLWAVTIFGVSEAMLAIRATALVHTAWAIALPGLILLACIGLMLATTRHSTRAAGYRALLARSVRHGFVWPSLTLLAFAAFIANVSPNQDLGGLAYWPVINPVDALTFGFLLTLGITIAEDPAANSQKRGLWSAFGAAGFFYGSAALVRGIHHMTEVPYTVELLRLPLTQTVLAVAWSAVGLTLMMLGTRQNRRATWIAGAILLLGVAAKLLLVDFAHRSSLEGIVAMIVAGAVLMLVGYVAPLPGKKQEA
jgi:uncharacterized membrane protein